MGVGVRLQGHMLSLINSVLRGTSGKCDRVSAQQSKGLSQGEKEENECEAGVQALGKPRQEDPKFLSA